MNIKELYQTLNGDLADASKRLFREDKVAYFIKKFPLDPSMNNLHEAVEQNDIERSFRSIHTLKGLAGNLGLTELYKVAVDLTEQLRPRLEYADKDLLAKVDEVYNFTIKNIQELD